MQSPAQIFTREVSAADHPLVIDLLQRRATPYETLLMRGPMADMERFRASAGGWWFGAFHSGALHALACFEARACVLYGDDSRALEELGRDMHHLSHSGAARSGTQQVLAEEGVMHHFDVFFQKTRKRIAKDIRQLMMTASEPQALERPSFQLRIASPDDHAVVVAFIAEHAMQNFSSDPRRLDRAGHENRCSQLIASGTLLVGRDKGKPLFLAELVPQPEGRVFLDRVYLPKPLQRRKIIAAALNHATQIALKLGHREVLLFAETENATLQKALPLTGFETRCTYRLVVLRS